MKKLSRSFEFALSIGDAIKDQFISEFNGMFPSLNMSDEDIEIEFHRDSGWDVDSNNLYHANLYTEIQIEIKRNDLVEPIREFIKKYQE